MADGRIFLKSLHDTSLKKDLSNEPNFARSILLDSTFKSHFRLEFKREGYCHFAIYFGRIHVDGMDVPMPCVVHILNNTGSQSGSFSGVKTQRVGGWRRCNKDVVMEALWGVWGSSRCRIDNSLDTDHAPYPKHVVRKRALDLAEGQEDYPPYHLSYNNCEHFASWVRNGVKTSQQVDTGTKKVIQVYVNLMMWGAGGHHLHYPAIGHLKGTVQRDGSGRN
jgi:hypothetical protein